MINNILLLPLGTTEIILIIVAILLLFGGKKIPELMRGIGRGVKEFKEGKEGETVAPKDPEHKDL
ncbi:MAG: twin-arginine translocase TatA/TatE family subunit [Pyrinomonadaceae bacterium]|nr:twin-arginine translocase TatA/TatE family subunit [Sphingobacteriaceae bacterium]